MCWLDKCAGSTNVLVPQIPKYIQKSQIVHTVLEFWCRFFKMLKVHVHESKIIAVGWHKHVQSDVLPYLIVMVIRRVATTSTILLSSMLTKNFHPNFHIFPLKFLRRNLPVCWVFWIRDCYPDNILALDLIVFTKFLNHLKKITNV